MSTGTRPRHLPPCGETDHGYGLTRTDFATSFEAGQPVPPPPAAGSDTLELTVAGGPAQVPAGRPGAGLTGVRSLRVCSAAGGEVATDPPGPARQVFAEGLDVPVEPGSELRYAVCPVLDDDLTYRSTHVAVDCLLEDGAWASAAGLRDRHEADASARGQGDARLLLPNHWNLVRVNLSPLTGRRVVALAVVVDVPASDAGPVEAWLDDVELGLRQDPRRDDVVDHVDTRRGTHSSGSYSRGNTVPATAMPNGFGFLVPLTDASSTSWLYSWAAHNDAANRPRLQGIGASHIPSPWMGDRNQFAVHPVPGASDDGPTDVPDASLEARARVFDHDDELARPHHYGVALEDGTRIDVTPTFHGGVLRFAFADHVATGHVVVDAVGTEGAAVPGLPVDLRIDAQSGTLTGWVDHGSGLSTGRSRMFVVGRFNRPARAAGVARGDRPHARYASFDVTDDPIVELRVATSFIGIEQAWHTFALELAERTFAEVEAAARAAWQERLSVLEVEGASAEQLATLYGNLYRLNLYPSSHWENAGSTPAPLPVHASPVAPPEGASTPEHTGAAVLTGEMYVNHGFWDTYRTCWPAYALLYPHLAGRLADGFVQQYREAGWIARWSSPGYADLMTGTSSDVAFADLLVKDVELPDPLAAYDAGLRNATVVAPHPGVGRKGMEHALLHGYVPRDVHESVSWSLEGYINDAGLSAMARRLAADTHTPDQRRRALADESVYLAQRARGYVHLFDPGTGFFRARGRDGTFGSDDGFDPASWGGDYTESDAWNFAFHAPHDGQGLARLHGGRAGLARLLDAFFATPERADRPGGYGVVIHEMVEARDVRLGQLGQSNQVSHHIPYTWLAAGQPERTQEVVREILTRLWTGNEIGQGYHGDEDNGEMSAWHVLSAIGLYPLEVGSPRWAVGAPLFTRIVVHHPTGDLIVEAPGNGQGTPYVRGLSVCGRPVEVPWVEHAQLLGGSTLTFAMSAHPTAWASEGSAEDGDDSTPWTDVSRRGGWRDGTGSPLPGLSDDDLTTAVEVSGASGPVQTLEWTGPGGGKLLCAYTIVSALDGRPAPSRWRLEVRAAGTSWTVVDERRGEDFRWPGQLRPFVLDEPVTLGDVRLTVLGADSGYIGQVELLVE